jgi:hypothetical protein
MHQNHPSASGRFPPVDRSVITVGDSRAPSDDKAWWLARTPAERIEALELLREIAFGYDPAAARLQRVLETAEFPTR